MMPSALPLSSANETPLHDRALVARRHEADALDRERGAGLGRGSARPAPAKAPKQLAQPLPALAGAGKALPVRDDLLDGGKRARREDRARDDDAGARLALDHEVGAKPEHARLQHHASRLGHRAEPAGDVARRAGGCRGALVRPRPSAPRARSGHAHGGHNLGVAPRWLRRGSCARPMRGRRLDGLAGEHLGADRERHQHKRRRCAASPISGWKRKQMAR